MPNHFFLVLLLSWWVVRAALLSQAATTTPGNRVSLWRTRFIRDFSLSLSLHRPRPDRCLFPTRLKLGGTLEQISLHFLSSQSPHFHFPDSPTSSLTKASRLYLLLFRAR